jgi:hypothetical protein
MADLRVAQEPRRDGHLRQRIYVDGHEISGVRRVRVCSDGRSRTASLDLDLDTVSIDPRTVSGIRVVRDSENVDLTVEADNVNGPVPEKMLPGWTRGPARAYRRPDAFDRARDLYARLVAVDWLLMIGVTYLIVTILGVLMEDAVLLHANRLRESADD